MAGRGSVVLIAGLASGCFLDSIGLDPTSSSSSSSGGAASGGGGAGPNAGGGGSISGGGGSGVAGEGGVGGDGGGPGEPWWDPTFGRRSKITFDNALSTEALLDFPVLIKLDPTRFDYDAAKADGDDVRFVDDNGSTLLAYEIETWKDDDDSWLWLRVPQIDAGSVVDHVWLYYGNADAPAAEDADAVWAGSHVGIYHLADDPGAGLVQDSTSGSNDGVPNGSMTSGDLITSVIGDGYDFDGTNDYVALGGDHVPAFEIEPGEARTIEAWLRTSTPNRQALSDEASCAGWGIEVVPSGALSGRLFLSDAACPADAVYTLDSPLSYADGTWHHVALVIDRANAVMRLHVDGALVATHPNAINNSLPGGGYYDRIGTNFNNTRAFAGGIDEVRVSSVARSTDWIEAQYASMRDGFASFSPTQTVP